MLSGSLLSYLKKRKKKQNSRNGHSFSLVVIRCHTSFVVPLLVTRCTTRCHSLSLVVTLLVTRCHSLSLDVPLVSFFINDLDKKYLDRKSLNEGENCFLYINIIFQVNAKRKRWLFVTTDKQLNKKCDI